MERNANIKREVLSMKKQLSVFLFKILLCSLLSISVIAQKKIRSECYSSANEERMYSDIFPWNQSKKEMLDNFNTIYKSGKRMDHRVFYEAGQYKMPITSPLYPTKYTIVPDIFIKSLITHIETALERGYVDVINFADMGHNHFFIPMDYYKKEVDDLVIEQRDKGYEKMMGHPDMLMLYHTAEQLRFEEKGKKELIEDRYIQRRFYTRNLIGQNDGSQKLDFIFDRLSGGKINSSTSYKEKQYKYWGGGVSFNATKNGCFSFKDPRDKKIYYFDFSYNDLGPNPSMSN